MVNDARALTVAHQSPGECAYCDERHERIVKAVTRDRVAVVVGDVQRLRAHVLSDVWRALRDAGCVDGMGVVNRLMEENQ
ncbi:hypothetical protein [Streptomyces sp. NPDC048603]|uniref:hypothetical protein n=1 Tax=Streptomyces sp. NPDC048603 TaxID=3365577 RepID=UPI003711B3EE